MNPVPLRLRAWTILLLPLLLVAGCHPAEKSTSSSTSLAPANVHVCTVAQTSRPATEEVVGTVRPKLSASIDAKISGRVAAMLVVPGQIVTNGQLLAQLDAAEINSRFEQASAALVQAESDWQRASNLLAQQASTPAEYDAAQARYRVAKGAAAEAQAMMSYCLVTAPFNGVITRKLADVGDLAMPGKPLLQMENPSTLRLEADVPEALINQIELGAPVAVRVPAGDHTVSATVAELSPAADPNSRTVLVKLELPDQADWRSGQFGRVAVPVGTVQTILIPAPAVVERGQMEIVFANVNGHAQLRLVKTGRRDGNNVEIVSGLNPSETIVTQEPTSLQDGQPLVVQP